jgi:hypothetical protein
MFQTTNQLGTSMIIGMIIIHTKYIKIHQKTLPIEAIGVVI